MCQSQSSSTIGQVRKISGKIFFCNCSKALSFALFRRTVGWFLQQNPGESCSSAGHAAYWDAVVTKKTKMIHNTTTTVATTTTNTTTTTTTTSTTTDISTTTDTLTTPEATTEDPAQTVYSWVSYEHISITYCLENLKSMESS